MDNFVGIKLAPFFGAPAGPSCVPAFAVADGRGERSRQRCGLQ